VSSLDVRSIDPKDLRRQAVPATQQAFRVFLSEQAFDRAVARGETDTTREIGGILVGELLRDDAGPYLLIDSTIDALHAEEKGAELTFTHATWEHIHKEMDGAHKDKRVVGWYHTHPGFGVFLSDRDQFIHKSFFNLPFQVALVYDPKSREHGVFTWHDNEVARARRYWIGPREQLWDGPRAQVERAADKPGLRRARGVDAARAVDPAGDADAMGAEPARDELSLRSIGPLGPLVVIGLTLLLLGGFAGRWLGIGSANDALITAQLEIAKARSEGAQLTIGALQSDLVNVLRDTLGDDAVHRPIREAINELELALLALAPEVERAGAGRALVSGAGTGNGLVPGAGAGSAPGIGSAVAAGAGSVAGSAVATGAGSGDGGATTAGSTTVAGSATTAGAGSATVPGDALGEPRLQRLAVTLRATRDRLVQLAQGRGSALAELRALELAVRRRGDQRVDLGRDVAEQRSGLGTLYAELAADTAKAGDPARARRLLATAAHLDPGNRARYELQLRSFDKAGTLPRHTTDPTGAAGQGSAR
jgi:proteasome lid subunit RPN8/RPN11